jgi:hypothetical protein
MPVSAQTTWKTDVEDLDSRPALAKTVAILHLNVKKLGMVVYLSSQPQQEV